MQSPGPGQGINNRRKIRPQVPNNSENMLKISQGINIWEKHKAGGAIQLGARSRVNKLEENNAGGFK